MKTLTGEKRGTAAQADIVSRRRERLFYTGMAVVFIITVFAGFARAV